MSATAAGSAEVSVRGPAENAAGGLLPALGNLFGVVADVAIGVFVALSTCFFLLKDGRSIATRAAGLIPGMLLGAAIAGVVGVALAAPVTAISAHSTRLLRDQGA